MKMSQIGLMFPDDLRVLRCACMEIRKLKSGGNAAKVKGNQIQFTNIKADSIAVIVLEGR